jgi:hypothetical protein
MEKIFNFSRHHSHPSPKENIREYRKGRHCTSLFFVSFDLPIRLKVTKSKLAPHRHKTVDWQFGDLSHYDLPFPCPLCLP